MTVLHLLPAIAGYILLSLHFFRADNLPAMLGALLLIAAMLIRHPWMVRLLQAGLALGAIEWLRTAVLLVSGRMEADRPFLRLAIILGAVALCTALAALVFRTSRIRRHFRLLPPEPELRRPFSFLKRQE